MSVNRKTYVRSSRALEVLTHEQTVLVPQPSDDPDDPLNWSWWKKHGILITIGMCTFLLDFQAGASIACLIPQGLEWGLSPDHVLRAANLNVIMMYVFCQASTRENRETATC